jgi:hypothetical protein
MFFFVKKPIAYFEEKTKQNKTKTIATTKQLNDQKEKKGKKNCKKGRNNKYL